MTRDPTTRRGLTFVELVIAMTITAMVAGGVAGILTAVSAGWQQGRQVEMGASVTSRTMLRIQKIIRTAKQIGACREGGGTSAADVLLWKGDLNGDGKVQFSELAMLEFQPNDDPTQSQLVYWQVSYPSSWTSDQKQAADATLEDDAIYSDGAINLFKQLANVVATPEVTGLTSVQFHRIDSASTVRPALEYILTFDEDGASIIKYGRTTCRGAAELPASQQ
jgi:hypothetical protein